MAEEVGIVMSLYDRVSPTLKAIAGNNKTFDKSLDELESSLKAYEKAQNAMTEDVVKLKQALASADEKVRDTRNSYRKLKDEASKGAMDDAIREQEELKQALDTTKRALKAHGKAYDDLYAKARKVAAGTKEAGAEISKVENRTAGGDSDLLSRLGGAGIGKMVGDSVAQYAGAWIESALGQPTASFVSSVASGVFSGAAMGSIAGPMGTAIGAGVGLASGLLSGGTQVFQAQDDAFRSYYQDQYNSVTEERAASLTSGSTLAAQRETDAISFATLFGSEETAKEYLSGLVDMSNNTPFLYDDLTAMSKTLATYGYGADSILPVLQTIGDAGAALGQSTGDMTAVATAIGRMKSSDKASLEYLNILNDRGIGAVGMLAEAEGVSQGEMYDMISKGKISGEKAANIILQAMTDSFAGSMEAQSKTFSGLTSTVEGLSQELDNAMGEGYNQGRMSGLQAQRDWLSGESGEAVMEANRAIGAWEADLENQKEQFIRDAVDAMMASEAYQTAKAEGDAAEMGRLIMAAKVQGMNEYNASDGAQLALASELSLAGAIREDAASNQAYWDAGYRKGQEFTKGLKAGQGINELISSILPSGVKADELDNLNLTGDGGQERVMGYLAAHGHAYGLDRVPYDNYAALLHQGERVLTASQAREMDAGDSKRTLSVSVTGNRFGADMGPEEVAEAIVDAAARKLLAGYRG